MKAILAPRPAARLRAIKSWAALYSRGISTTGGLTPWSALLIPDIRPSSIIAALFFAIPRSVHNTAISGNTRQEYTMHAATVEQTGFVNYQTQPQHYRHW